MYFVGIKLQTFALCIALIPTAFILNILSVSDEIRNKIHEYGPFAVVLQCQWLSNNRVLSAFILTRRSVQYVKSQKKM